MNCLPQNLKGDDRLGRLIFILLLSVSGLIFLAIIFGMYIYMKRTVSGGKSLMEEPVNEQPEAIISFGMNTLLIFILMKVMI